MGREAYRMGVRFVNAEISKDEVVQELLALGAIDTFNGRHGQVEMEIPFEEGYLEMLIYNQREYRKLMDDALYSSEDMKHLKSEEAPNNTLMEMRFAKLNSVDLVDKIMEIMIKLHNKGIVNEVGDLETRQTIVLENYSDFKERVKAAKAEYESWHHSLPYPIRCSEVYDTYHKLYPHEYILGSTNYLGK